jgi:TP53 regulating kinase and related kinases
MEITTFFMINPSVDTDDILSREMSNSTSPVVLDRVATLPSVSSKMIRWFVKVSMPFLNLSSAQSSCRILFSPCRGLAEFIFLLRAERYIILLNRKKILIKKGAEADIYLINWYGKKAISKIRVPKYYRHRLLDKEIRRQRTIHEATMISAAKKTGVISPFIYFIDPLHAEIIMEFIEGINVKDVVTPQLCFKIGYYAALLHDNNIIHGDLTTSNFIFSKKVVLVDFGLSYYSSRLEDKAVDIRLIKQAFSSAHNSIYEDAYKCFTKGYSQIAGKKKTEKILQKVAEIEQRGRYARVI